MINAYVILILITSVTETVNGVDLTLVSGSSGAHVVRAVLSKIETSDAFPSTSAGLVNPFMRKMAYVETRDGAVISGGGIWNISPAHFTETHGSMSASVHRALQQSEGQDALGPINWESITYENLSIPLYSGLAARILIHRESSAPQYTQQAGFWNSVFKNSASNQNLWQTGVTELTMNEGSYTISVQCINIVGIVALH